MLNTWIASPNETLIGNSSARALGSAPRPGASTKKSSSTGSRSGATTSMYPPAPRPVSSGSVANELNIAPTAASTAFPPARSTSPPAWAVSGWPAAMTPRSGAALSPWNELWDVELAGAAHRLVADAADARLACGFAQPAHLGSGPLGLAPARRRLAEARRDHRYPHLVDEL